MVIDNKITTQENPIKRKNLAKIAEFKILIKLKNHDFSLNSKNIDTRLRFFTPKVRVIFTKLRQVFVEVWIFHYFDMEYNI